MRRRQVNSSSLRSIAYDSRSRILEIEFHSGRVYQYLDVSQTVFEELLAQDSLGAYFNTEIRDIYASARVR
jgi:hypothetical protein